MAVKVDAKFLRKKSAEVTTWQGKVKGVREILSTKVQAPVTGFSARPAAYGVLGAVGAAKVTWEAAAHVGFQELALIAAILDNTADTFDLTEKGLADAINAARTNPLP